MEYLRLLTEFETQLKTLEHNGKDILYRAEKGIELVENCIKKLQKNIIHKKFDSQADEIYFFKHVKPKIFSKLIYYVRLFKIECKRPIGNHKSQTKYLKFQIDRLKSFFNDNLEFYNYYHRGAISFDEQYFVRGNRDIRLPADSFHFLTDNEFSTCKDSTVATILAYDMLIVYLQGELDNLNNLLENPEAILMQKPSKLFWTGSKTDLIELIYALHSSNTINSGTLEIKELAAHFEHLYNVDLGNYYHTFIEIRSRKTGRTKFLNKLIDMLKQRMEALDD